MAPPGSSGGTDREPGPGHSARPVQYRGAHEVSAKPIDPQPGWLQAHPLTAAATGGIPHLAAPEDAAVPAVPRAASATLRLLRARLRTGRSCHCRRWEIAGMNTTVPPAIVGQDPDAHPRTSRPLNRPA